MLARPWNDVAIRRIAVMAVLAAGWLTIPAVTAAELDKLDSALKLVPEDAAFYSSMMRNREQFEILRGSRAWAKIERMPIVQMGVAWYGQQLTMPESGSAKLHAMLENPEFRKIVDLVADMASDEVFVVGDDSCTEFVELAQSVAGAVRYGPMMMQATGNAAGGNPNQLRAKLAISALAEHADLIEVPNVVIGFRVKNIDLAKEELIKLEMFGNILESNEQTKGRFKKTKVGDHDYLVLKLDGGLLPWDQIPVEKITEMELEEGDAEKVVAALKEANLVLALGLRGNDLLVSVGSSLECLESLGNGPRLVDRAELKPLEKFVDKRLTGIAYVSKELKEQIANQKGQIDGLRELADELLPMAKLTEEQNERVRSDIESLTTDLKSLTAELGPAVGFSFLTDGGMESYRYNWDAQGRIDGSKPLGLLRHVGGNPLLAVVSRATVSGSVYEGMVKWAKVGYGYFQEFGLPRIPERDRAKVQQFLDAAMPHVAQIDRANREMLMPALADGQSALVVDAKLRSKQFIASLPATPEPMPMLEPAIVMGVRDAKLLKQGLSEYRRAINGIIDAARQIEGNKVPPEVRIPEPQTSEGPLGTVYGFPFAKELGVDEQVVLNIGVSDSVAVVSVSKEHTERLLKSTPLAVGGVLAGIDRPRAAAIWINWKALVDAAIPWVDFAIVQTAASKDLAEDQQTAIVQQARTALEVLKVVYCVTSESYLDDGVLVQHSLTEIHDVKD
jgi:hypothetical protein